jgi:hypothetical protein
MTCCSPQIFSKIFFGSNNTSPTKANDMPSDFTQIPATIVARKSRLKVFNLKNYFSTCFDSKYLENTLRIVINLFMA